MTLTPPEISSLRVVPLHSFAQGGRWRTEAMRSYSQPVLLWFTKGQGRVTVSGNTSGFGPHNAIFIPPGTMHGFELIGQVFGWIVFFQNDLDEDMPEDAQHLRIRDAVTQAELNALVENLDREANRSDQSGRNRALRHHASLLMIWLERHFDTSIHESSRTRTRDVVSAYSALIERDFKSPKTVRDYAAELGITSTHLSRVCNAACGKPASQLLADRKHFEARRLLTESRTPVKDIAQELGFSSAAYFTRAFHGKTGKTPSAFRRST